VLAVEPELLYERQGRPFSPDPGWGGRGWLLLLAVLLALPLAAALRLGRGIEIALAWAVLVLFLLAALIWTVAWLSPFPEGRLNQLMLVFVPWDVVVPFLGVAARRHYARARVALLAAVSLLAVVGVFTQPLAAPLLVAFAPFALLAFVPPRPRPD
jgi:hypothetical protein